jgi:hypothetical protein
MYKRANDARFPPTSAGMTVDVFAKLAWICIPTYKEVGPSLILHRKIVRIKHLITHPALRFVQRLRLQVGFCGGELEAGFAVLFGLALRGVQ